MRENPSLAKLDRVLVSIDWASKFNGAYVQSIRPTSDHVSICLRSGEIRQKRAKFSGLKSGSWNLRRYMTLLDTVGHSRQTHPRPLIISSSNLGD